MPLCPNNKYLVDFLFVQSFIDQHTPLKSHHRSESSRNSKESWRITLSGAKLSMNGTPWKKSSKLPESREISTWSIKSLPENFREALCNDYFIILYLQHTHFVPKNNREKVHSLPHQVPRKATLFLGVVRCRWSTNESVHWPLFCPWTNQNRNWMTIKNRSHWFPIFPLVFLSSPRYNRIINIFQVRLQTLSVGGIPSYT